METYNIEDIEQFVDTECELCNEDNCVCER